MPEAAEPPMPDDLAPERARGVADLMMMVASPVRIRILAMLTAREMSVGQVCAAVEQSQPATSHHIALLRVGGLISFARRGRNNFYAATEKGRQLARAAWMLSRE